jgi:hypothetical protein
VVCLQLTQGLAVDATDEAVAPIATRKQSRVLKASARSEENWQDYWSRSGVALADEALERLWYRNLYFLHCSLREGVTVPGLFANWSYRNIGTAWHGDYHMNYNTQQPFWVTFSSNHVEKNLPTPTWSTTCSPSAASGPASTTACAAPTSRTAPTRCP